MLIIKLALMNILRIFLRIKMNSFLISHHISQNFHWDIDLQNALDVLSQKDKAIIILKYFEEKTLEEIADILEENVNTIKSRLYRSIKKLRKILSKDP